MRTGTSPTTPAATATARAAVSLDQALWAEAQLQHLLPVSHFHLGFTVPRSLRPFFVGPTRALALDALFAATSETILQVAHSHGLRPGVLAVLHTWTQKLELHPHLHCLITGGGLGPQGFVHRRRYLLPLKILRPVFKAELLDKLRRLVKKHQLSTGRHCPHHLLRDASLRDWNIDIRRPLAGPQQVIRYFARYTRRIAISDKRLLGYDGQTVTFLWRDRAHGNRLDRAQLDGPTFCRRFLNHVLPDRFVRIRRYGLLSNRVRTSLLQRCRELLDATPPAPPVTESRLKASLRIFGRDPELCPKCHKGRLIVRAEWRATRLPLHIVIAGLAPRAP